MSVRAEERRVRVVGSAAGVDAVLDGKEVEGGEPEEGHQKDEKDLHGRRASEGCELVALI